MVCPQVGCSTTDYQVQRGNMIVLKARRRKCSTLAGGGRLVERRHTLRSSQVLRARTARSSRVTTRLEIQVPPCRAGGDAGTFATTVGARKLIESLPRCRRPGGDAGGRRRTSSRCRAQERFTLQTLPPTTFAVTKRSTSESHSRCPEDTGQLVNQMPSRWRCTTSAIPERQSSHRRSKVLTLVATTSHGWRWREHARIRGAEQARGHLRANGARVQRLLKRRDPIEMRFAAPRRASTFRDGVRHKLARRQFPTTTASPEDHEERDDARRAPLLACCNAPAILTSEKFKACAERRARAARIASSNADRKRRRRARGRLTTATRSRSLNVTYLIDVLANRAGNGKLTAGQQREGLVQRPGPRRFQVRGMPMRI